MVLTGRVARLEARTMLVSCFGATELRLCLRLKRCVAPTAVTRTVIRGL